MPLGRVQASFIEPMSGSVTRRLPLYLIWVTPLAARNEPSPVALRLMNVGAWAFTSGLRQLLMARPKSMKAPSATREATSVAKG